MKNRTLEGTGLKEVWAEGEIAAPALEVQAALMEVSRLRFFMPYMKDYVVRLELKESLSPDGTGTFRNEWHAVPDFTPRRHDIIRLTRDDGSWVVTPRGEGKPGRCTASSSTPAAGCPRSRPTWAMSAA